MNLDYIHFSDIDLQNSFFDSLKDDYAEFSDWYGRKAKAGESAYVFSGENSEITGFLYLKIEEDAVSDVTPALPAAHRIKVGTMKINAHGTRLGERFVKKIFDHAIHENAEEVYVTLFAHHASLVSLYKRYGFTERAHKITPNGEELVLVKTLSAPGTNILTSYPLVDIREKNVYLLSLRPMWHTRLLPDSILRTEDASIVQDISHTNSIHKVYLAAMDGLNALTPGDILLIYRTTDQDRRAFYRSVATSVCAVEEYRDIGSFGTQEEFIDYCRPYSVFNDEELNNLWLNKRYPHVIRFTYNFALSRRLNRQHLIQEIGLNPSSYWGFMPLTHAQFKQICQEGQVNESLIVY